MDFSQKDCQPGIYMSGIKIIYKKGTGTKRANIRFAPPLHYIVQHGKPDYPGIQIHYHA